MSTQNKDDQCINVKSADEDDPTAPFQLTIQHTERVEQSYDDVVLA